MGRDCILRAGATFSLGRGPAFEPDPDESIAAQVARRGADPHEVLYDTMSELAGEDGEQPGFLHVFLRRGPRPARAG